MSIKVTKPAIRIDGFRDDWKQSKLGELVQFSKGSGYSKGDLKENGTPIILYGRLYTKYETVISDVDTFVDAKVGSIFSRGGEVVVPASGESAEDISIEPEVQLLRQTEQGGSRPLGTDMDLPWMRNKT
jgi:type I restriction enzyme S subunit